MLVVADNAAVIAPMIYGIAAIIDDKTLLIAPMITSKTGSSAVSSVMNAALSCSNIGFICSNAALTCAKSPSIFALNASFVL